MTLLAFACGLAVATVYLAQPLLDAIARSFAIAPGGAGVIVTVTQAGYAAGLILLVPLGDRLRPRALIAAHLTGLCLAVAAVAASPSVPVLLAAMTVVGVLAVVVQTIVAFAASMAGDAERGAVVGTVTSGVVIGILLSRVFGGLIAQAAGWRAAYLLSAGALLLAATLTWRTLPDTRPDATAQMETESYAQLIVSVIRLHRSEALLRRRGTLALLAFAAFSTLWTSLVLPLSAPPLDLGHGAVGAFGLVGVAGALAAARAGRLADHGHARATTGVALTALTIAWLPIGLLHVSLWALVAGLLLLDLAVQAVHVTSQTLLYSRLPHARSRLAGAYMVCYSAGSAIGAVASTVVYAAGGWTAVCLLGAGFSLAALGYWTVTERLLRLARRRSVDTRESIPIASLRPLDPSPSSARKLDPRRRSREPGPCHVCGLPQGGRDRR